MSAKKQAPARFEPELQKNLAAPFPEGVVRWKVQTVTKDQTRCLVVPYVDARVVMDRLDAECGLSGWQDDYTVLPSGAVICRLMIRLGDEWITRVDVGGESEQPDAGDRTKAAVSDALKRAAVKFGVGRFVYKLKPQWVDYDRDRKAPKRLPTLPAEAVAYEPDPDEPEPVPAPAPAGEPEPAPRLSKPQSDELRRLLIESEANLSAFCEHFGTDKDHPLVDALDLHPGRYMEALQMLKTKIARMATAGNGTKKARATS